MTIEAEVNRCAGCHASVGPSPGWHDCALTAAKLVERLEARLSEETKAQDEALALCHKQIEDAEAQLAAARAFIEDLKTEPGRVAFALAIGWPLPEELAAARRVIADLRAQLDGSAP